VLIFFKSCAVRYSEGSLMISNTPLPSKETRWIAWHLQTQKKATQSLKSYTRKEFSC